MSYKWDSSYKQVNNKYTELWSINYNIEMCQQSFNNTTKYIHNNE